MKNEDMDPGLIKVLNELHDIPERNPQVESRGRVNFLKQAAILGAAVSRKTEQRHNGWFYIFQKKEHFPIMNALIAIVLALTVFFGGSGATVYASQDSLPGQFLYPVKTMSENALVSMSTSTQTRLNYLLDFSDRRIEEMAGLLSNSQTIPESVVTRLQTQLEQALQLAAGADSSQGTKLLEQVRLRAQTQVQLMTMLMSGVPGSIQPLMQQAMLRIQEQVQLSAMGETDLPGLMIQIQQQQQYRAGQGSQATQDGTGMQTSSPMMNASGTPMQSGNGTGSGGMMPSSTYMGSGGMMPTGTPGQYDPGPYMPSMTPQPGGGNGRMP